jgi:hypothetical protein
MAINRTVEGIPVTAVERRLLTNELTEGWEVAVDQRCVK